MLVEINLLPQKEPRKTNLIIILSIITVLLLFLSGYYFLQIQSTKNDISDLDRRIEMTMKITEATEKNASTTGNSMSVDILKNAVAWANSYPIQTIPVMQYLTSLLPERGFIQSFSYTEAGTVSLTVQFDSVREAAYFLDHLNDSSWVEDVNLSSLTAQEKEETSETTTHSSNTETTDQTATSAEEFQPVVVTLDPNNPNKFTFTPVTPNVTETTEEKVKSNENYLPRYIGQFEIKFNKETIKKLSNGSSEEGVTES
jgi:hypothetical protein